MTDNICAARHGTPRATSASPRVAFHDHPLFIDEDRLSASLRALFGRYRAKVEADDELYLRRRLSASLSTLLELRWVEFRIVERPCVARVVLRDALSHIRRSSVLHIYKKLRAYVCVRCVEIFDVAPPHERLAGLILAGLIYPRLPSETSRSARVRFSRKSLACDSWGVVQIFRNCEACAL